MRREKGLDYGDTFNVNGQEYVVCKPLTSNPCAECHYDPRHCRSGSLMKRHGPCSCPSRIFLKREDVTPDYEWPACVTW